MNQAAPAAPEQAAATSVETVEQGWTNYSTDMVSDAFPELNALLRFTYYHAARDLLVRIKAINTAAIQHRDAARAVREMNALVGELNTFFADEANIPTAMPEAESEQQRIILPPNAGRLS